LLPQPLLYLSAYFDDHRQEYYNYLLQVSRGGDWEGWLGFFLTGIHLQAQDAVKRIERLESLRNDYRQRLQGERAAERLMQVLDVLFERPILSVRQVQETLQVPYQTASRYIEKLVEMGLLREITGQSRNRLYQADEILRAIDSSIEE
jgi:Fic family protein